VRSVLQTENQYVQWQDQEIAQHTRWLSESNQPAPARIVVIDDQTTADEAYRFACEGTSLLWRGDFHNARQYCRLSLGALSAPSNVKPAKRLNLLLRYR
jgi:hypothetical protein